MKNRAVALGNTSAMKERSTSPGWGSWLGFLLFGFGAVTWLQNEGIVAWLLSEGIVAEASTRTLPAVLKWISVAIAAVGLTAAWRILAVPASAIFGWAPVQVVAAPLKKVSGTVLGPLWALFAAAFITTRAVFSSLLAGIWLTVTRIAQAVESVARNVWLRVTAIARAVESVARKVWLRVTAIARAVESVACKVWLRVTAIAKAVESVARSIWLRVTAIARAVESVARNVWLRVTAIARVVESVARNVWLTFSTAVAKAVGGTRLGAATMVRPFRSTASVATVVAGSALRSLQRGVFTAFGYPRRGVANVGGWLKLGASAVVDALRIGAATAMRPFLLAASVAAVAIGSALRSLQRGVFTAFGYPRRGVATVGGWLKLGRQPWSTLCASGPRPRSVRSCWPPPSPLLRPARPCAACSGVPSPPSCYPRRGVATVGGWLKLGASAVVDALRIGVATMIRPFWLAASVAAVAIGSALGSLQRGVFTTFDYLRRGITAAGGWLKLRVAAIVNALRIGAATAMRPFLWAASTILHHLGTGVSATALALYWTLSRLSQGTSIMIQALSRGPFIAMRTLSTACYVLPDVLRTGVWAVKHRKGVSAMSESNLTREHLLSLVVTVLVLFTVASVGVRLLWPSPPEPTVEVVHWSTGHLTRDGLLKDMAKQFKDEGHATGSGTRIVVEVYDAPSELQGKYLSELLRFGTRRDLNKETNGYVVKNIPDPTIVTPSSAHWLITLNYEVGRAVVNLDAAESIVRPVIGIVTYEEMAKCLGWPEKELGYADIIALRADPQGWAKHDCAKAEWGQRPLVSFTDPTTSSTGRSLHLALYAFAAKKLPQDLTIEDDVKNPEVVDYVKEFQGLIDHYLIGTTVLNTKIHQGPGYGHFFIMPEDNLIHLYEGTEKSYLNGIKTTAPPIDRRMVMIYPKEGSMPRNNCACIVEADWVSEEQVEASKQWIEFIREDERQRVFMSAGFRPGTDLDLNYPGSKITSEFGLNPDEPKVVLNPSRTRPEVAAAIDDSWELVKRPGIVTFVVDTSGSMMGNKLQQAQGGLIRALDNMARNNQVGLVTFNDTISTTIPVRAAGG